MLEEQQGDVQNEQQRVELIRQETKGRPRWMDWWSTLRLVCVLLQICTNEPQMEPEKRERGGGGGGETKEERRREKINFPRQRQAGLMEV